MTAPMTASVMVRNTSPGPTVFDNGRGDKVEWQGAGDSMGGDIQPVPGVFLNDVQFQRMKTRGIFEIVEDESIIDATTAAHRAEWRNRQDRQRSAGIEQLDETPNNDTIVKTCIGPSGKAADQLCGADVPVRVADTANKPPLCPMHTGLSSQFVPRTTERVVEGKPEVVWMRARLTAANEPLHD